jgi:aspartyl aminopeptidase
LRIPTLAIHLDRSANDKFEFNKEAQLTPILATAIKSYVDSQYPKVLFRNISYILIVCERNSALNAPKQSVEELGEKKPAHHSAFLDALATEMKVLRMFYYFFYNTFQSLLIIIINLRAI